MPETLPNIELSYGTRRTTEPRVIRRNFGEGRSQRSSRGINGIADEWRLVYEGITTEDLATLEDFFKARAGTEYFLWTPHGEASPRKWTTKGSWTATPATYSTWNLSVTIQEEFDA